MKGPDRMLAVFLAALLGSCGRTASRPNVVVVSLDTLRADALTRFGSTRGASPNLDAFLEETCVFTSAYVPQAHTLPSHASLFTSLHPFSHGVEGRLAGGHVLAESIPTLASVLAAEGYATAAFVNAGFLHRRFRLDRGFDVYDHVSDIAAGEHAGEHGRDAAGTNRAAFAWLDEQAARPFFLFVHYMDVHSDWNQPYEAPEEFEAALCGSARERFGDGTQTGSQFLNEANEQGLALEPEVLDELRCLYDAGVSYADEQFAAFMAGLRERGLYEDALIVVLSDHGEEFQEHKRLLHTQVYEENVHVPLAIKLPASEGRGPSEVEAAVGIVDVMPTVLELVDVPFPPNLQGRSLAGVLRGGPPPPERAQFFVSEHTGRLAILDGSWKLVYSPGNGTSELYDLARDPHELDDVAGQHPQRVARLVRELETWINALPRPAEVETAPEATLDEETIRELQALGY